MHIWQVGRLAAISVLTLCAFLFLQVAYLYVVIAWGDQATRGLNYYGRPVAERNRFKRKLYLHSLALAPVIWLLSRTCRFTFRKASFSYRGVAGPKGTCSAESFQRAADYRPQRDDVFVATQMKSGTTWMQHIVYQVLTRGEGGLPEDGTALNAVSPWLESLKTVSVDEAPRVGVERPSRVIKTHLPVELCPYSTAARYIYVVRHPVSCFASCVDFVAATAGTFAPASDELEAWFTSDELMWWSTWPSHVRGWWEWSQRRSNVLFIAFEEMREDLRATVRRVAQFLEIERLSDAEIGVIAHKCGFGYMRTHSDAFEMNPPHVLQSRAAFLVSGRADRYLDVPETTRERILAWCRRQDDTGSLPVNEFYPDLAESYVTLDA